LKQGEEYPVKYKNKGIAWLLIATFVLLVAAACGPAQPPAAVDETNSETPAEVAPPADVEAETTPLAEESVFDAELPTPEPVVLEGAITTDSGLQYLETTAGTGPAPQVGDILTMDFTGTLPDGTVFGETYSTGEPVQVIFGRDQLLPGWEEGVALMKEGGSGQLVLPPELAFGAEGFGLIPPNSQIILDVELLSVSAPPTPAEVDEADLTTTDTGLQYYDMAEGEGMTAETGSTVSTNFSIWTQEEEGPRFVVSSEGRDPISFVIGNGDVVFPGWEEAVTGMQPGGKRYLVVPPDLGLGAQGGGDIPPDATLIMEVELVDVREPVKRTEVDPADFTETESGLKYYDIVEGDGPSPESGQMVSVHYTGWLEDGTQFDSSLDRGQPFSFPVDTGSVIAGWDEGVLGMKVGGKRQLVIPADLAYGDTGSGIIPPGATIIFDVELLELP
jgi:peptidylprolyl isomerase